MTFGATRRDRAALALVAWVASCTYPRTEVVVRVDSDLSWGSGQLLRALVIDVRAGSAEAEVVTHTVVALGRADGGVGLPLSFGMSPRDQDASRRAWVQVLGCGDATGCGADGTATAPLVVQRALVGYVSGETRRLDLLLSSRCRGRACGATETCDPGTGSCVSAVVSPDRLRPVRELLDAAVVDAPTMDATRPDVSVVDAPRADVPRADTPISNDVPIASDRPVSDRPDASTDDRPAVDRPDVSVPDDVVARVDAPSVDADVPVDGAVPDAPPDDLAAPPDAPSPSDEDAPDGD